MERTSLLLAENQLITIKTPTKQYTAAVELTIRY